MGQEKFLYVSWRTQKKMSISLEGNSYVFVSKDMIRCFEKMWRGGGGYIYKRKPPPLRIKYHFWRYFFFLLSAERRGRVCCPRSL